MAEVVREIAAKLSLLTDKASFRAGDAAISATKASLRSLSDVARELGAVIAPAAGFMLAKKAFIDFNSDIEQLTISLAATQKMFKGGTWENSMKAGAEIFDHYQEVARKSIGTTKDFAEVHREIASSIYAGGGELDALKDITKGVVVASHAMSEPTWKAAMDVRQAMSQGVQVRDRWMLQILAAKEAGGAITQAQFNAMSKMQRIEVLRRKLTTETIKQAADTMEKSFAGVTSTLKDNLQIAFGKIGLPLFKQLTAYIDKANSWLEKNPRNVLFEMIGRGLSEATSAFKILGGVIAGTVAMLQTFNKEVERIERLAGSESALVKVFQAIANPIKEAYETLRDIVDYMSGEASAMGLSMAIARGEGKAYAQHAKKGGKFGMRGQILAKGEKPGVTGAYEEARGAVTSTIAGKSGADFLRAVQTGNVLDAFESGGKTVLGMGALAPEMIGKGAMALGDKIFATRSPWADIPYAPGVTVSGERLTSSMPGPWALPRAPVMASGLTEPTAARVSGDVNIKVKVDVPNLESRVERVIETKFREGNELFSKESE